jgi:WD40 repeat protein
MKIDVKKTGTFLGHKAPIYALAATSVEGQFFSAGGDGQVARWHVDQPDQGFLLAQTPNPVYTLCFLPQRNWLVVGQNFQGIHLIDLASGKEAGSLKLANNAIFDIQAHGDLLYVAAGNGQVFCVDVATLTILAKCQHTQQYARTIALFPERQEIAVGYSDSRVRILDMRTLHLKQEVMGHEQSVFSLVASADGQYLLSGSRDAFLKIWKKNDENQYALYASIVAHMYTVNHLAFSLDGKYFATCSKDKSIKLWETENFKLLKVIDKARHAGHGTSINKLLWLSNSQLISGSDDRSIAAWQVGWQ